MGSTIGVLVAAHSTNRTCIDQLLSNHSDDYDIYSAANMQEIGSTLDNHPIQIAIINLDLPELSSSVMNTLFTEQQRNLPVILVGNQDSNALELDCLNTKQCHFIHCSDQQLGGLPLLIDTLLRFEREKQAQKIIENELLDSRERYLDIFENTSDLIQCVAVDGSFLYTNSAWKETLRGGARVKPWSWADTWPVARLRMPARDIDLVVLEGATGRTLAFAPGHLQGTPAPGSLGYTVISAHRDTHFRFLQYLNQGERLLLQDKQGIERRYRVTETRIFRHDRAQIPVTDSERGLVLVTCYPFDQLGANAKWRYLVYAVEETGRQQRLPGPGDV